MTLSTSEKKSIILENLLNRPLMFTKKIPSIYQSISYIGIHVSQDIHSDRFFFPS